MFIISNTENVLVVKKTDGVKFVKIADMFWARQLLTGSQTFTDAKQKQAAVQKDQHHMFTAFSAIKTSR